MKIAQFTDSYKPQVNGVVSAIEALNKAYTEARHKVHVFAAGNTTHNAKTDGISEHYYRGIELFFYKGYYVASPLIRRIDKIFEKEKFDIIHAHSPYSLGLNAIRMAKKYRIPIVVTFHTNYPEYVKFHMGTIPALIFNPPLKLYLRWYHNKCDAVTTPSEYAKKILEGYGIKNVHALPNGISLKRYHPSSKGPAFRKKYKLGKEPFVLFLGRVSPEKDIDLLVRRSKDINAKVIICGKGPALQDLKQYVKKIGADRRVKFIGFLSNTEIAACYSAAGVFATPSKSETQGLTVLEAMACKTPAVVIDSATAEKLSHGKNGFVAKDEDEFVSYINKILGDGKLRARMSREALVTAKQNSLESFGSRTMKIYKKLL